MKVFTSLAILLPLFGATFAAPAIQGTTCQEYNVKGVDEWRWTFEGFLNDNTDDPSIYTKNGIVKVDRKGSPGIGAGLTGSSYSYTVSAGFLAVNTPYRQIYAKVERDDPKGLGQAFLVKFYDASINGKVLKSYKIYPNQACQTPAPFGVPQIGKIGVFALTD